MSEQNPLGETEEIEEVDAVDFAEEAAALMAFHNDWGIIKDSLKAWLKGNVGSKIEGSFEDLDDEIIKSSRKTAHKALDYLKDCKRHVQHLVENPDGLLTVHNNPPRINDNLPDPTIAETIGWWEEPIHNGQASGAVHNTQSGD